MDVHAFSVVCCLEHPERMHVNSRGSRRSRTPGTRRAPTLFNPERVELRVSRELPSPRGQFDFPFPQAVRRADGNNHRGHRGHREDSVISTPLIRSNRNQVLIPLPFLCDLCALCGSLIVGRAKVPGQRRSARPEELIHHEDHEEGEEKFERNISTLTAPASLPYCAKSPRRTSALRCAD